MIAIDPGTVTGFALDGRHGTFDLSPIGARKAKEARPAKIAKKDGSIIRPEVPAVPERIAEPELARCGKLWSLLCENFPDLAAGSFVIVEGAAAFQRGKAAVRVSHELRGVVKAWCWKHDLIYQEIQPNDLKRFITGRFDADKALMVAKAKEMYGYAGDEDNEADALHLLHWGRRFLLPAPAAAASLESTGI